MKNFLKQILSFILPVTVLVLVPIWIERDWSFQIGPHLFFGIVLILLGLTTMAITIASFIQTGKGTLAPWAPPKTLVILGPYGYVRNPMILGVLIVLCGEALSLLSRNILIWAVSFFVINTIYFIMSEEPDLEQRFGEDYREYKKHVSRWIPRRGPYSPRSKAN